MLNDLFALLLIGIGISVFTVGVTITVLWIMFSSGMIKIELVDSPPKAHRAQFRSSRMHRPKVHS